MRLVLRRMLNVLLSFSYMLRGGDVPHLRLLVPFYPHIEAVLAEIAECLKATAAMAAGRLQEEKIVATHHALDEQIQTLLAEVESTPPPLNCSQADAVLGYASLGVLVAAVQTVSRGCSACYASVQFQAPVGCIGHGVGSTCRSLNPFFVSRFFLMLMYFFTMERAATMASCTTVLFFSRDIRSSMLPTYFLAGRGGSPEGRSVPRQDGRRASFNATAAAERGWCGGCSRGCIRCSRDSRPRGGHAPAGCGVRS